MADLESTGVVAGREGHAEIHEGLEIDGAMSTRQAVQGTPKLALERFIFDTERERGLNYTSWQHSGGLHT